MGSDVMSEECPERRFRTLFISDVHLGARGSQAERLLDFLRSHDADTIYLVGDIVDGWALQSNWHWPQSHNDFVQKMLRKARKGAKVIYVPGNHDEFLRNYYGTHFGGIDVVENTVHVGVVGLEEVQQPVGLRAAGSEMDVGDKQSAKAPFGTFFTHRVTSHMQNT
jgi:predicted MPP superfamily phosphohydrolase